jgi:hypothetical protein
MDNFDRSSLNRAEDPSPAAATKETVVIVRKTAVAHKRNASLFFLRIGE